MKERLERIRGEIAQAAEKSGQNPNEIKLIGVTKYTDVAKVQAALDAGLKDIGENRVQDAKEKFAQLKFSTDVTRHMIGHLQSNKAKEAVALFDLIQTVDSEKLALEIDKQAQKLGKKIDILIQVNCSDEEQKSGADKKEALALIEKATELPNVEVKGLMTMAALTDDEQKVREAFRSLRNLGEQAKEVLKKKGRGEIKYLSMGMSGDFKIAIEEGSNMVRIGSALFK